MLTRYTYTGNGVQRTYSIPFALIEELNKDYLDAYVNGVLNTDWEFLNEGEIQFDSAPAGGASTRGASALADWNAHKRMSLPDRRDLFIMGKDAARAVFSYEADAFQGHYHGFYNDAFSAAGSGTGVFHTSGFNNTRNDVVTAAVTDGVNGTPGTDDETRPKNQATRWIIRY